MDQQHWQIWIDTGGTFTDCMGMLPDSTLKKIKVLSNSSLRGTITEQISDTSYQIRQNWQAPSGFVDGFTLNLLNHEHRSLRIIHFDAEKSRIDIDQPIPDFSVGSGMSFEARSTEEAPILAARLLTGTQADTPLPPLKLRLATTKGTNALLEQNGAPTLFITTAGFKDLLKIGDQRRPDLFALNIHKPEPLYEQSVKVGERMDANGSVLSTPDFSSLKETVKKHLEKKDASIAVCLMHSYKNPAHEQQLKQWLCDQGTQFISVSSELSPLIKILPRAQTTLVNACLDPILNRYLESVNRAIGQSSLRIMTSAGGLSDASNFHPKDSLLSGPAGGVVGASTAGRQAGFDHIISFDMGGTSTDVARFDGDFDYTFRHTVGNATLNAPALSIETVAAGGGSVCSYDGQKLTVGPDSAGANPGPACYGAGGPLTITDVNLLLGRLDEKNFGIPVDKKAAQKAFQEIAKKVRKNNSDSIPSDEQILEGFLHIANERMAEAIRTISTRKGYDPAEYALVGFGGAGGQHACAIASELDISNIIIPADAGLLSAYGLGNAVIEEFAERQILQPLNQVDEELEKHFRELQKEATDKLDEQVEEEVTIRRNLAFMRLEGQDTTLKIDYEQPIEKKFKQAYQQKYGHWVSGRTIELESIRVVASTRNEITPNSGNKSDGEPEAQFHKLIQLGRRSLKTPVFNREQLEVGHTINGPALVLDPYSTIVVEPEWSLRVQGNHTLHLEKKEKSTALKSTEQTEAVALELFTNRFTSIAREMGEMLRRTALSVNVKERMDFSCALLNPDGELVVNAPHIPVHLGALGLCVRKVSEAVKMKPGDVIITNHPAFGGSHLPDITIITPIFTDNQQLLGYAASRAHHAEIGGSRPGSMPPDARNLAEEGVVIPPMHLIKEGSDRWEIIRSHFLKASYPTRNVEENIADLQAAVAANHRGSIGLQQLAKKHGRNTVIHYMSALKDHAAQEVRQLLEQLENRSYQSVEFLDDGSPLRVTIQKQKNRLHLDFEGTASIHPGNLNATPAIVNSVVMYVLRVLIDEPLPLNDGLLEPVEILLPKSLLNPTFGKNPEDCPAVVGGNTEVSQRLTDLLLKPFGRMACSQGTMNNVLFGNERFGYYETIGGGTGAGSDFDGTDAIHHHMTNTAGTDPEILEHRYPVRLERYAIRSNSGGKGLHRGGDGIVRELQFLENVSLSVLTQHRTNAPYGSEGGSNGRPGLQRIIRKDGSQESLKSVDARELQSGDRFIIETPGGGGYGSPSNNSE